MSYYIYKYVKNNIIEYIGQTTNLEQRIKQHTKDKLKNFSGEIYYFECPHKTAMDSWEYFLINKYHPKYNKSLNESIDISIKEPEWKLYMNNNNNNNNNIINFTNYLTSKSKNTIIPSQTKILYNGRNQEKTFKCYHCSSIFKTTNWYKTKTKFGATCPCCYYTAYTK